MCQTCTADLAAIFATPNWPATLDQPAAQLRAGDGVIAAEGEYRGYFGHVVHTNGPTVGGVRRIQIRLTTGALVIVPETDLTAL